MLTLGRALFSIVIIFLIFDSVVVAQRPPSATTTGQQNLGFIYATLSISVRDDSGVPIDGPVVVRVHAAAGSVNRTTTTRDVSTAVFDELPIGEYEAEASYPGYQTIRENVIVSKYGSGTQIYIYLVPESESKSQATGQQHPAISPKLQNEIDKGVGALRKHQFESGRAHFAKGLALAPGNPDLSFLLGTAEIGLEHPDLARQGFEHALAIDPGHERSLLALGELQLRSGDTPGAIATLEKAFLKNGGGWRTHLLLATAYAKNGRLPDAEAHAYRAAELAREQGGAARLMLGEIQKAEGKLAAAQITWQDLATKFPGDPASAEAKARLASLPATAAGAAVHTEPDSLADLPVPAIPAVELLPAKERPWAPPDIDSREFPLAQNAACSAEDVLLTALQRLKSQLQNFEKFTATEHIEHQEIDRLGRPGPVRTRAFSYIVFVNRYADDSFFLNEDRYSSADDPSFPTSLATQGLNNLGVAILQPANRIDFEFKCEGLASIRGKASWQIRFEEKKDAKRGVRNWWRDGKSYQIPVKGRVWISSASSDVLRIETDLREPVPDLALNRDHLQVEYGPVNFAASNTTLWLPWSAEMHMELHGHRYHHKHYLTDYMLFGVDANHKVGKPKDPPAPPSIQAAPAGDPNRL